MGEVALVQGAVVLQHGQQQGTAIVAPQPQPRLQPTVLALRVDELGLGDQRTVLGPLHRQRRQQQAVVPAQQGLQQVGQLVQMTGRAGVQAGEGGVVAQQAAAG